MARFPLFLDDPAIAAALDEAAGAALTRLAAALPPLEASEAGLLQHRLRNHLAALLTGRPGAPGPAGDLPRLVHGEDAFGDPFSLEDLPLPRPGTGYAVQLLDTDCLLDRVSGRFLPVRDPALAGLFETFEAARAAARSWLKAEDSTVDRHPLAVIPARFDQHLSRHVLIYGVLTDQP